MSNGQDTPGVFHHVALQVAALERGAQFFVDVFEAEWAARRFTQSGERMERLFGRLPGLELAFCHVRLPGGLLIELVEVLEPEVGLAAEREIGSLPHLGIWVDDAEKVAGRVEAAGGRIIAEPKATITPDVARKFFYCSDPSGNTLDVTEAPAQEMLSIVHETWPESRP
jgi:catechol 2,3-dioxygenase-like lactoylglutathione lyase family enzyme